MSGVLKHTMVVRNPDTLEATALLAGEELPDWATDLVDEGNLEAKGTKSSSTSTSGSTPSGDGDKGYAGMKLDELAAEAEKRELTVTGTGANDNVLKGDLVAALEAHDAAQAGA